MRDFKTPFGPELLSQIQAGTKRYTYKGLRCLKSPFDLAIYAKLLWDLRPGALIELGTLEGGSALWFADILTSYGLPASVLSIDAAQKARFADPRITFLSGNVLALEATLPQSFLDNLRHPWAVVDDSAHTYEVALATLTFFGDRMKPGDVLVIEDGSIDDLGRSAEFNGGPNRAVRTYFEQHPSHFSVLSDYCDMFGKNATYNPNGYLVKL
jgi:cephalosporin hydroxylase